MNNPLDDLLRLSPGEKKRRGIEHTPAEIAGQVELWPGTWERVRDRGAELRAFLEGFRADARAGLIVTGAGTSEFVGTCLEGLLRRQLGLPVNVFSTTRLVTHPADCLLGGRAPLLLSFARSGNSPESTGAVRIAEMESPGIWHLGVTCNAEGELARLLATMPRARVLSLDERTDDRGLAMTASFSNMVIAGQAVAHLFHPKAYAELFPRLLQAGRNLLAAAPRPIAEIARLDFNRAVFLGGGSHLGTAVESHLKLQELTAGQVMCTWDSFPGLRHGPQAVIHGGTLVVAFLSADPYARRYETDLLEEIRRNGIGRAVLAVADRDDGAAGRLADVLLEYDPDGALGVPDDLAPPVQVIAGQLLGLFTSLHRGLRPDAPSEVIHRVVEGVRVYDPRHFRSTGEYRVIAER